QKGVTAPIIGATKVEHVEEAVRAVELKLSEDDNMRLDEKYKLHPILGHR
ncbi:MAG: aldo/keto reductase, partial [Nitrososphaerota archaeon]|nr:aldo/keto reductase [Nitrososphaerota archaeon]